MGSYERVTRWAIAERVRDGEQEDQGEAISFPLLKYPWPRLDSGSENKEEWVIIADRLEISKKGVGRDKGISTILSL